MTAHPLPLCPTPLAAYDLASRAMAAECRDLGASLATARFEPQLHRFGWWSPLFDVVLATKEGPDA
jgi:hypothetical protein